VEARNNHGTLCGIGIAVGDGHVLKGCRTGQIPAAERRLIEDQLAARDGNRILVCRLKQQLVQRCRADNGDLAAVPDSFQCRTQREPENANGTTKEEAAK